MIMGGRHNDCSTVFDQIPWTEMTIDFQIENELPLIQTETQIHNPGFKFIPSSEKNYNVYKMF